MNVHKIIRFFTALVLAVTAFGLYMMVVPPDAALAAPNEINGTVFLDYNNNGQQGASDTGVAGVTVTAYNASGAQVTSTITQADGTYTLSVPDGIEVRVEFTNIPVDLRPGAVGIDSDSTVVFVTSPVDNVDMGLVRPEDYCQDDPYLASPCYFNGDPLLPGSQSGAANVLRSFPSSAAGQDATLQTPLATGVQIGPTWGLAFQRSSRTLLTGALMKRHFGFGPLGTGGIYSLEINPANGQVVSGPTSFLDLDNDLLIDTGTDPHSGLPAVATTPNTDPNSWDAVGKISIGDMDMSVDDERLWVMNLYDQTLYSLNVGIPATAPPTSVVGYSIVTAMGSVGDSDAASCAASDVRPWAVEAHQGYVYVGVVCSAQSIYDMGDPIAQSDDAVNALRAYILRRPDNDNPTPGFEFVYKFDLDYPRSHASSSNSISARWRPWIGTMTTQCQYVNPTTCNLAYGKQVVYPQPILSDIVFDDDGSIVVGLMDRAGHQMGNTNYATSSPWGAPTLYRNLVYPLFNTFTASYPAVRTFEGVAPGDILRICEVGDVYSLENNATCGSVTTTGQNNTQGPGGGEYYYQDNYGGTHTETVVGGLVLLPGTGEVGTSVFDPFDIVSGGVSWYDNQTGARARAYEILPRNTSASTFGKAAGLGDVEAFCYQPPIEIGNRVWNDQNEDGIQDPGEAPLANVTLELYQGSTLIAATVTDPAGNFIFSSALGTSTSSHQYNLNLLPNTAYEVRIPSADGASQQAALAGLLVTDANTDPSSNGDSRDSDGQLVGDTAIVNLTSGGAGDNNHTFDFGFKTPEFSLGNWVWFDTDNSSTINGSEVGVNGVRVELYQDDGTTAGEYDAGDTFLSFDTTDTNGYYRFDNLPAGDYAVLIPSSQFGTGGVLDQYWSSGTSITNAGVASDSTSNDPDTDADDSDDNGLTTFSGGNIDYVSSAAITLGPLANEPTTDNDPATNPEAGEEPNAQSNRTVDFGFYRGQLGNLVFVDANTNGTYDAGDTLLAGATVQLYAADGTTEIDVGPDGVLGTADDATGGVTTGAGGTYQFGGLPAGDYIVRVTPPAGYISTVDTSVPADTTDPDANFDDNDNGVGTAGGAVSSNVVTLTPGSAGAQTNNTVTDATGTTYDPTLDFGFVTPEFSLGNWVWFDTDNSSTINGSEVGVNGVRVELYQDDGTTAGEYDAGDTFLSFDTTDTNGYYRFDNLPAGDYAVLIPSSQFGTGGVLDQYWSSGTSITNAGVASDSTSNDPDTDADDSDDNGLTTFSGGNIDYVSSAAITLGPLANEPTTDNDPATNPEAGEEPNAQSNRTVDFGFYRGQLGNLVFVDANTNGTYDAGDTLLAGATVQLYAADGTTEIDVGPDGVLGTADDATGGVTTGAGGTYQFGGLPAGDYIVRVTPPAGYISTVDTSVPADTTDPDANFDDNDNGVGTAGGAVSSNVVTLTPGSAGAQTNNTVTDATGTTYDPTLDFGFVTPEFSFGNRVWFDTDNSSTINGSEVGVNGVRVELYQDDGTTAGEYDAGDTFLSFDTTDTNGYYRFDNLPAGDYAVLIPSSQFGTGGVLDQYWSSGTSITNAGVASDSTSNDPDTDADDSDDNGLTTFSGGNIDYVSSAAITLGPLANEPTTDNDPATNPEAGEEPNAQSNRTVDFGFYRGQLGNLVFVDANTNGTYDAGDTLLAGATVQLYAADGTTEIDVGPDGVLGTADDATGGVTTGAGGTYQFGGLPAGDYIVRVTPPAGYISTVDTSVPADTTDPDANFDDNDNGVGTAGGAVSSNVVTLTPGSAGAQTNNTVTDATGTTYDPTLDFGFVTPEFSLGNWVWFDTDNSSTINGSEVGVNGVRVELYQDDGTTAGEYDAGDTFLSFDTTDTNGYYRFDNLPAGDYAVLIPSSQFGTGGVLDQYWSSGTSITNAGVASDSTSNDPDTDADDSDDNGLTTFSGGNIDYVSSAAITLGPLANEPTTDNDPATNPEAGEEPNAQSNRTVDFGFYRGQLGNLVFVDANTNGTYDAGDTLLAGATVQLYAADGTTEIDVGPDGVLGTADDATGGVTTGAGGTYQFGGLPAGDYIVRVTPPAGYISTVDTSVPADTTDPDANFDDNDNGVGTAGGAVSSNVVTLTPGSAGAQTNNTVTDATGTTYDPTLDFGFVTPEFSLGNRVWFDTDNSSTINGSEVGVNGVRVELYQDDGTTAGEYDAGDTFLSFDTTDTNGYYRFDNLPAGDYAVLIPSSQFGTGGVLDQYWSSGTSITNAGVASDSTSNDPDTDADDSDDNGLTTFSGGNIDYVSSAAITLGPLANEPTTDNDPATNPEAGEEPNAQSNRTVDFGFYRGQLGNLVFVDANTNGTYDAGDTLLAGATVQLYAADGTTEIDVGPDGVLGTADDATGGVTTGAGGTYQFGGLPAGDYIVRVTPPAGYISTVDTSVPADTTDPDANFDDNDNGVGTAGGAVSSNVVTLTPGSAGAQTNNTVTDATGTTYDPTLDFGFPAQNPAIQVTKTITAVTFNTPQEIQMTYSLLVENTGNVVLNNVQVTDDLATTFAPPASFGIVSVLSGTLSINSNFDGDTDGGTNPTHINLLAGTDSLAVGANGTITLVVLVDTGGSTNTYTNTANAQGTPPSGPDVQDSDSIPGPNFIDPAVTKAADPSQASVGDVVRFTITVFNNGNVDATGVVVTDTLPDNLDYVSTTSIDTATSLPRGTITLTPPRTVVVDIGNLAVTDVIEITIVTRVNSLGQPPIQNEVLVVSDPPPVGVSPDPVQNNISAVTLLIVAPPGGGGGLGGVQSLPATGFSPNRVTVLPDQTAEQAYADLGDLWMEIPSLGVKTSIVGVPRSDEAWNVDWLWEQAGWLEGSAFPTWQGNSVVTGHVYLPNGQKGPFVDLNKLRWGDQVIVHAFGQRYVYEIRTTWVVLPDYVSALKHEEQAWLTLVTCKGYNEGEDSYRYRVVTRAVLTKVEAEP